MADDEVPKPQLRHGDILVLQGLARREMVELPNQYRLEEMKRDFDPGERLALCYFRASLLVLNRKGAFQPGFLEAFEQNLMAPNSDPGSMEDPEWEVADDGKGKRRP
jgi:hypothetical protein